VARRRVLEGTVRAPHRWNIGGVAPGRSQLNSPDLRTV
jgi:hypothetical protein